jgi:solute carrier family 10 (sodium/bile acid cotransporter), member 7
MKRPSIDPFLAGICLVLPAAWLWPEMGATEGLLRAGMLTKFAIGTIFLIQGLSLDGKNLKKGFFSGKVHLFTQGWIFAGWPIMAWLLMQVFPIKFSPDLHTGILFLAVLPTTISTAVVYTEKAGGNPATALFNVTLANFLGILVVPLAMMLFQGNVEESVPLDTWAFFRKIILLLALPFGIGQAMRNKGFLWMDEHKAVSRNLCQGMILFILWAAFSNSFAQGVFSSTAIVQLPQLFGFVILLTILVRVLVPATYKLTGMHAEHHPSAFFCSTEKTLAAGLPMATALFGSNNPALAILILPVLIYHPLQLFLDGVIASGWSQTGEKETH